MKLSDAYLGTNVAEGGGGAIERKITGMENIGLELTIKVFNVNIEANGTILKRSKTMEEYSRFVDLVRSYSRDGEIDMRTMQEILRICKKEGILVEFLEKYGTGAISALCREWTEEEVQDLAREEGYEEGRAEGRVEGSDQNLLANIRSLMITLSFSMDQAMEALQVPEEKREKLKESLA